MKESDPCVFKWVVFVSVMVHLNTDNLSILQAIILHCTRNSEYVTVNTPPSFLFIYCTLKFLLILCNNISIEIMANTTGASLIKEHPQVFISLISVLIYKTVTICTFVQHLTFKLEKHVPYILLKTTF